MYKLLLLEQIRNLKILLNDNLISLDTNYKLVSGENNMIENFNMINQVVSKYVDKCIYTTITNHSEYITYGIEFDFIDSITYHVYELRWNKLYEYFNYINLIINRSKLLKINYYNLLYNSKIKYDYITSNIHAVFRDFGEIELIHYDNFNDDDMKTHRLIFISDYPFYYIGVDIIYWLLNISMAINKYGFINSIKNIYIKLGEEYE
ncbi:hypothetical protein [Vallitalea guaymasensis]|uniref:hypothetical protein n=1 Tax=Vallitalea guaymasensis TaxID=1185412 RepID=UPI000DE4E93C|nr:hypothetical protein [Vallitalea guaymasensis]